VPAPTAPAPAPGEAKAEWPPLGKGRDEEASPREWSDPWEHCEVSSTGSSWLDIECAGSCAQLELDLEAGEPLDSGAYVVLVDLEEAGSEASAAGEEPVRRPLGAPQGQGAEVEGVEEGEEVPELQELQARRKLPRPPREVAERRDAARRRR